MKYRNILIAIVSVFALTMAYLLIVQPGRSSPPPVVMPSPSPSAHGDGLSDSHDGYLIQAVQVPVKRGKAMPVAFRILGQDGKPLVDYETVQTKQLHMYLIRDDISGYQHLHPTLSGDTWSTTMDVDDGGAYRIYAEFTPRGVTGHSTTLGLPFIITGDTKVRPLPGPAETTTIGGYAVKRLDGIANLSAGRSALLQFQVSDKDGRPVSTLEEYLGAMAHLSAFEVRTQGLSHVHGGLTNPGEPLTFHVQFPNRGEQRLFMEFKVAGQVHRAGFTVFVT